MATFTLVNNKIIVKDNMRLGSKMRLRLTGVGGDRKAIQLHSTNPKIADGKIIALFNGPKGIWTVEINTLAVGNAEIQAKQKVISPIFQLWSSRRILPLKHHTPLVAIAPRFPCASDEKYTTGS